MRPRASGTATSGTAAPRSATRWPTRCVSWSRYSTFQDLTNPAVAALADRVAAIAPMADAKVFLTSGGSDSIDTATKMVRRYWQLVGQPERTILMRRERAYHGMHLGRDVAGRHRAERRRLRTAAARRRGGAVGRRRCAPRDDRAARARTGSRPSSASRSSARAGSSPPPPGYLEEARAGVPRDRRAVRGRRGHHRVRAHRRVVRQHPLGPGARPRDLREGHHERVPAAGRGACGADRVGAVLRRGRGHVPPRLHVLGARGRRGRRDREPRHHGAATTSWRVRSSWRRTSPRDSARSPTTSW